MPKRSKLQPSKKVLLAAVVILAGLVVLVMLRHTTNPPTKPAVSASSATKGESANQQSAQQQSDNPPGPDSSSQDKTSGNSASGAMLVEPNGDFVSNHHPNLSGTPAPNLIASNCTTTPGATCKIVFTKGGTSRSLSSETTDAGGSAFWNWKLQDIGLTEGTWSIQAIATLNGQTKTATDAQSLVVSP